MQGIPANGKRVEIRGLNVYQVVGGKIVGADDEPYAADWRDPRTRRAGGRAMTLEQAAESALAAETG